MPLNRGKWSEDEERDLLVGIRLYGHRWKLVASVVKSRDNLDCAQKGNQQTNRPTGRPTNPPNHPIEGNRAGWKKKHGTPTPSSDRCAWQGCLDAAVDSGLCAPHLEQSQNRQKAAEAEADLAHLQSVLGDQTLHQLYPQFFEIIGDWERKLPIETG
jgi:hypothetical protein